MKIVLTPGELRKRESRFMHLFSGEVSKSESTESGVPDSGHSDELAARVERLEAEMAELKQRLATLLADKGA